MDVRRFYFQAAALTAELNRQDLVRDLVAMEPGLDAADLPTWRLVFRQLLSLAAAGPLVVVLDELQYLTANGDDVTSQLAAACDQAPAALPLTLVLSGSEVSAMEHLASGGAPLYGRITWSRQLRPFDYRDAARMADWLSPREAAYLYGILGGLPRYLASVHEDEPLAQAVTRTFVADGGEVRLQMDTLIEQEKGIRRPAEYRSVLRAVAAGRTLLNDIAMLTGLEEHSVRHVLEVLIQLELVRAEQNFAAGPKSAVRYRIADGALAFWHRFLLPRRSQLAMDRPERFWAEHVVPDLDTYMGGRFEQIVREAYRRYHATWGLPPASEWARWEGLDRERQPVEIDIAARLADDRLLVGEIKWSSSPWGPTLHTGLVEKVARLAASGQGWAHTAGDMVYLYASASGFTSEMQALARADPRVRLLDLADLYPDD